jgi:hypothetical protein
MSNIKKLMVSAGGGAGLDVDEVFSTYLYEGNNGTAQSITNGIDLSGEDGLVWIKQRSQNNYHYLFDTQATGATSGLLLPLTIPPSASTSALTSFNSDGFSLGSNTGVNGTHDMVSWTFRKAPKFFDIVTYTGNGVAGRQIAHNLGCDVGMLVIKGTSVNNPWSVWHNAFTGNANYLTLNSSDQAYSNGESRFGNNSTYINPTSSNFTVGTVLNDSGETYVAFLFAHNDGDGGFGPEGDQDIIKCGSHTISTTDADEVVDLGFEAQWVLTKQGTNDWILLDTMRGLTAANINDPYLRPNATNAEGLTSTPDAHAKGFTLKGSSGNEFVYVAIRRGSLFPPESATDVFTPLLGLTSASAPPQYQATHTIDMVLEQPRFGDSAVIIDRLRANGDTGKLLNTATTGSEGGNAGYTMDFQTGAFNKYSGQSTWYVGQCFRRAPGFFDMVAMTGTSSSSSHTVNHNLTVPPEMVWIKRRDGTSSWSVYHNDGSTERTLYLETTLQAFSNSRLDSSGATSIVVSGGVLDAGATYIMYLFASLDGISKVGSYTGNGSSQTINCGFTSGARFVLVKRADATANWMVMDTARGIVTGDESVLFLDSTSAEATGDWIDPASSGFIINDVGTGFNENNATYIFYAIA